MSLPERAQQALRAFSNCPGWEQRARLLLQWGEQLQPMLPRRTEDLVQGCESQVWLTGEEHGGTWFFRANSDARLLRGLLAVLLDRVNGLRAAELAQLDIVHWFSQLGLSRQLSPSRANGMHAVVQRMRQLVAARQHR
jgi:cysteine desulfuration protein SufE